MAMENTLFIGDVPIETPIPSGFPFAMFDYRRVIETYAIKWNPLWSNVIFHVL